MHLIIINGSPRSKEKSNTEIIISSFIKGYAKYGNTYDIYNISERSVWERAKKAFCNSEHILIAFPLFAETLPGILMEFLEELLPLCKNNTGKKMSFILQSALLESCQRKCCEKLLEKLPNLLGCDFKGTLSVGDMFPLWLNDNRSEQKLKPIENIGEFFANNGCLFGKEVRNLSGPEYVTKDEARLINRLKKFAINEYAEKLGCIRDLTDTPYMK